MIYTTYFAKLKDLSGRVVPISICGKAPKGYKGLQYKSLAPKWEFFQKWKENGDNEFYTRCFKEQVLAKLNPKEVEKLLYWMSAGRDVALVCYEKPGDFCHRHLVAEWLNENGIVVKEWEYSQ